MTSVRRSLRLRRVIDDYRIERDMQRSGQRRMTFPFEPLGFYNRWWLEWDRAPWRRMRVRPDNDE